jgi:hypothetical protein
MSFTESPYVTRGQIDGFKESADDAFWGPAEGFFRPILRFDVQCGNQFIQCTDSRPSAPKMPIRVARILQAPIRAHAAHIFCARGAEPKSTDFKESAEDAFGRLQDAFFCRFFAFSTQCRRQQFISTRGAHTLHTYFAEYAARRVGFKELAEDAFLRAQNAFFRLFLQFSACEPMFCAVCGHMHTVHTSQRDRWRGKIQQCKESARVGPLKLQKRSPADASEFKRGNKPNALPMQREK